MTKNPCLWLLLLCFNLPASVVVALSCTLTITGPAMSLSVCRETAAMLNTAPDLLANGVALVSPFNCTTCKTSGGSARVCNTSLAAKFSAPMLLQWYANAWAVPAGGVYGTVASMLRVNVSNPTCTKNGTCHDLLPLRASVLMGGGEESERGSRPL